jgi:hypothetical protein
MDRKLILIVLIFALFSCDNKLDSEREIILELENLEFNSEEYSNEVYAEKLNSIIKEQEIDLSNRKYVVVVINSEIGKELNCSQNSFYENSKKIAESSRNNEFVFLSNDSSIFKDSVHTEIIKTDVFKKENIVHSLPYLYQIVNDTLRDAVCFDGEVLGNILEKSTR